MHKSIAMKVLGDYDFLLMAVNFGNLAARSPNLSTIDRPYTSSYKQSVVSLALDCFVSEILLVLYRKCDFCTYPVLLLRPKFGDVPL